MNTKRLFIISALTGTLAIGAAAYASPDGGRQCGGKYGKPSTEMMQKRFEKMAEKLGLSDEKVQQIKAFQEGKRNDMQSLHEQRQALREEMSELDPNDNDYDAKLAEIANTKADLTRSMTIAKGESRKQMAQILTPEEQAKMKEMHQHRKGGFNRGFGKRHNGKQHHGF